MTPRINKVKQRLSRGEVACGALAQLASPEVVEIIGAAGYDWVWIDLEHGSFGLETAVTMLRAAEATGVTPIVRVPDRDPGFIMRILDAGAMGVMVPGVSTAAQARSAVTAARYSPLGSRGACPWIRAAGHRTTDWHAHVAWSNQNVSLFLLVEGREGVENFDSILDVPGFDAIVIGPFDLAQSLGHPGEIEHPDVTARIEAMVGKARSRGIEVVSLVFAETTDAMAAEAQRWIERGSRIVAAGSDKVLLSTGFGSTVHTLRGLFPMAAR